MRTNQKNEAIKDSLVIETLACRDALVLAVEKGITHVVLETDCQTVFNHWKNEDARPVAGQVLREMKSYLHFLQGFKMQYVSRQANGVAHTSAREALSMEAFSFDFNVIPVFLIDVGQTDSFPPNNE